MQHKRPRLTRECVRLGLYLALWVVVATGTIVEVIIESQGIAARASIAVLAWFGGIVTYRLASMLWIMWHSDRKGW
jgi:hypothetical protein